MKTDTTSHDRQAPYWAMAFVLCLGTGIATTMVDLGAFWRGYVLDILGPAWCYILFRLRFTAETDNAWTRFFTPATTLGLILTGCFGIELIQYLGWYDSTFDPWDLIAYISVLVPLFLLDAYYTDRQKALPPPDELKTVNEPDDRSGCP